MIEAPVAQRVADPNALRYTVPVHLDETDGIGKFSTRQLLTLTGTAMFIGPVLASLMPEGGPSIGDALRAWAPALGAALDPGALPLLPTAAWVAPVAGAGVLSLPFNPPPEHGMIAWAKYRASLNKRLMGPVEIDALLGKPTVERDLARAYGGYIAIWEMPSVSMRLASQSARNAERARWAAFLDTLPCPIQTSVRATPVDLSATFDGMAASPNPNGALVASYLKAASSAGGEVQRQRLLTIRGSKESDVRRWAKDIEGSMARAMLRGRRLEGDDLEDTVHHFWTSKPRKSRRGRLGPSTIRKEADAIQVDGEWVTTVALQKWPPSVAVDWMENFYDGDEPIDVIQYIRPLDTVTVRRSLEDRLFRLQTTTPTRKRMLAIEQLNATLWAIEGRERIYETGIYFLTRHATRAGVVDRRRAIQTLAGEVGAVAATLRWEHADGALACAGVGENRLLKRNHTVDTSSISRTYWLGASELGLPNAVPWGRTLSGNRRVVWTPFARPTIPNPNICMYCTSGGGKGFAAKIWTSRAILAGILDEAFFMDQAEEEEDGEYGRWARYLNGEVRKIHRHTWEEDLKRALADIPTGKLPPAITLNVAELSNFERCRAMVGFKTAVFERAKNIRAPRAFGLDELHSYVADAEAAREAEDVARRGRHFWLNGWFITQQPVEALRSNLGQTVQSQCGTRWYGMQSPSEISDVSARLRWTPEQVAAIERFGPGEAMLEAGMHRVAFTSDFTPEEYGAFNTDYNPPKPERGARDAVRSDPPVTRDSEPPGRPVGPDTARDLPAIPHGQANSLEAS